MYTDLHLQSKDRSVLYYVIEDYYFPATVLRPSNNQANFPTKGLCSKSYLGSEISFGFLFLCLRENLRV